MTTADKRSGLARIPEAMQFLGVSRTALYSLMDRSELPYVKLGRCRRIAWEELYRLVESHSVGSASR